MVKERSVAGTKNIQASLPLWGFKKTTFGAFTKAGEKKGAAAAKARKFLVLGLAKLLLPLGTDQIGDGLAFTGLADAIFGIDKVIAAIEAAILFNG